MGSCTWGNNSASYCLIFDEQTGKMRHNKLIWVHTDTRKACQLMSYGMARISQRPHVSCQHKIHTISITVHIWLYFFINLESSSSLKKPKQGHLGKCNSWLGLSHLNCIFTEVCRNPCTYDVIIHSLPAQEQKTAWTQVSEGCLSLQTPKAAAEVISPTAWRAERQVGRAKSIFPKGCPTVLTVLCGSVQPI